MQVPSEHVGWSPGTLANPQAVFLWWTGFHRAEIPKDVRRSCGPACLQLCGFGAQSVPIPALQFWGTPCGERVGNRADREPEGEGGWKEASRLPHHSGKLHSGREEQERQDEAQVVGD